MIKVNEFADLISQSLNTTVNALAAVNQELVGMRQAIIQNQLALRCAKCYSRGTVCHY